MPAFYLSHGKYLRASYLNSSSSNCHFKRIKRHTFSFLKLFFPTQEYQNSEEFS